MALADMGKIKYLYNNINILIIFSYRTNSKTALAKDLVEGIEKDLEKLRR